MSILGKVFARKGKKKEYEIDYDRLPVHIAVIPDGNGRWANKKSLPRSLGHREGSNVLKKVVIFCDKIGIKYLTVYAFSTENWKRPKSEVDALMSLLLEFLKNAERELDGSNVRIRVIGDVNMLPQDMQREIARVVKLTAGNTGVNLNIALNYGGRHEIIAAIKKISSDVKNGIITVDDIDEKMISSKLYTLEIPDPDLLIRTSGEKRSSNFLLWQLAYTEFWYTDVLWPDFRERHLLEAIHDFQNRSRRFGGI